MSMLVEGHDRSLSKDAAAATVVRRRYDRIAGIYDVMNGIDLLFTRRWRTDLWASAAGPRILEVGVGTGINFPFYPRGAKVTALDISPRMLRAAARRAEHDGVDVYLEEGDVQALRYPDHAFDSVVATFVFCSVPDPVGGLREVRRVLRPGGRVVLLEHVIASRPWLARLMHAVDPVVSRFSGAHIDRDTVANVERAGFSRIVARPRLSAIVQQIEAYAPEVHP